MEGKCPRPTVTDMTDVGVVSSWAGPDRRRPVYGVLLGVVAVAGITLVLTPIREEFLAP